MRPLMHTLIFTHDRRHGSQFWQRSGNHLSWKITVATN